MTTSCTIMVEPLTDGSFRATCALYPDAQAVAPTYEAALRAFEQFIEEQVRQQQGTQREEPTH